MVIYKASLYKKRPHFFLARAAYAKRMKFSAIFV